MDVASTKSGGASEKRGFYKN